MRRRLAEDRQLLCQLGVIAAVDLYLLAATHRDGRHVVRLLVVEVVVRDVEDGLGCRRPRIEHHRETDPQQVHVRLDPVDVAVRSDPPRARGRITCGRGVRVFTTYLVDALGHLNAAGAEALVQVVEGRLIVAQRPSRTGRAWDVRRG